MTPWKLSLAAWAALGGSLAAAPVDYLHDVKPILTQHCVRCHGADKEEAGLKLDTAEALAAGGDNGSPLRLRERGESLLVQVVAGTHADIPRMPYKKPPLNAAQIETLRNWVKEGAKAPGNEVPGKFVHWAFMPPVRPPVPAVQRAGWSRNDVDRYILARLEEENIAPAPEADAITLLRRVSLDLTGLPPTPAEADAFLNDKQPGAYERAVERLLASPHHGERWARPWLDVARYADSNGYSIDAPRQIWKYRDWVIAALNHDMPFDQFVVEQLAGDLLPNATTEQKVATGFNRNTQINQEGGIDPEQFRIEAVMDRVNTYGTAFLGLTVGCSQCHDHKFDPLLHKEYYQFFAFFNNTVDDGHGKGTPGGTLEFAGEFEAKANQQRELEETQEDLERYLNTQGSAVAKWIAELTPETRAKLRPNVRGAIELAWDQQSLVQKRLVYAAFRSDDTDFKTRNTKLQQLERAPKPVHTLVMKELPKPRESFLFIKGDFTRLGEPVKPGTPAILPPLKVQNPTRLDLARWTVDPANPLTARVLVNRIWQQYFGRGIVETENDFGTQGTPPSHPELLDWLATELVARNWSMKAIHRLIVTSATYRQSSQARPDLDISDPTNRLLARQTRLRLDAEIVRDVSLAASGLLVRKLGGPPVFPPQPDGVMNLGQVKRVWRPSTGDDRYRRGLYTHLWRATPHPALAVFDEPDAFSACTRRLRSNTPLQALTLLNDQQYFEFAGALAGRIEKEAPAGLAAQVDYAFRLCLTRAPKPTEAKRLAELFENEFAKASGEEPMRRTEAWTTVARVLLNLDETITRE
ncbi:MAG TPA: PSD1 and planctomycete cytochrome C domain-containing protein [Opitutaceae bacterium]|nr:PSD1 and planctomycete cytochrome C domain-containing protein [Opitutaceae bacterium]